MQQDASLAERGRRMLDWAEMHMPVLINIRRKYSGSRPLAGKKIGLVLHVTKETGVLARTLKMLGGELRLAASNPLSTQDDIANALKRRNTGKGKKGRKSG